jgi:hypothetical protein
MKVDAPLRHADGPLTLGDPVRPANEELIIKEARQRHRRRLLVIAGIVAAVIAGIVFAAVNLVGDGSSPKRSSTNSTLSRQPPPIAAAKCVNGQIKITSLRGEAGTGNVDQVLGFVNTSKTSCTLTGYPQVAALDVQGTQVAQAEPLPPGPESPWVTGATTPPSVTLNPGQTASAIIQGTAVPTGWATSCPSYPAFLVTPPNQTQPVIVTAVHGYGPGPFPGCSPIKINPIVPGTSGQLSSPAPLIRTPPPPPGSVPVPTTVPFGGPTAATSSP